jgi:hypothetical protein
VSRLTAVCRLHACLASCFFVDKLLGNRYKASYKRRYYDKSSLDGIVILYYKERDANSLEDFC